MARPTKRLGYADPPYINCAHLYSNHPDHAGEVDHVDLIRRLESEYDGWVLHGSSPSIGTIEGILAQEGVEGVRCMAWVKTFAAFKRNVPVAYAWEPVWVKPIRKPVVSGRELMRDWIAAPIAMKKGLTGAKPEDVCRWAFEVVGADPDDEIDDMFPGTGAVQRHWDAWSEDVRSGRTRKRVRTMGEARAEIKRLENLNASLRTALRRVRGPAD